MDAGCFRSNTVTAGTGDPLLSNVSLFRDESSQFEAPGDDYDSWTWYWNGEAISGANSSSYNLWAGSKNLGIYELLVVVTTAVGEKFSARCRVIIRTH